MVSTTWTVDVTTTTEAPAELAATMALLDVPPALLGVGVVVVVLPAAALGLPCTALGLPCTALESVLLLQLQSMGEMNTLVSSDAALPPTGLTTSLFVAGAVVVGEVVVVPGVVVGLVVVDDGPLLPLSSLYRL